MAKASEHEREKEREEEVRRAGAGGRGRLETTYELLSGPGGFERLGALVTGAVFPGALRARRHVDRRSDTWARGCARLAIRGAVGRFVRGRGDGDERASACTTRAHIYEHDRNATRLRGSGVAVALCPSA